MSEILVIIMAGGLGKRMNSSIPKVLHKIGQEPMLVKIIQEVRLVHPQKVLVVVGKYYQMIKTTLEEYIELSDVEFVLQKEALGTGHAIQCCIPILKENPMSKVLILSGDVPLLKANTMLQMIDPFHGAKITTTLLDNPQGYGRIIEKNGRFQKIVEEKDCSVQERYIQKVNCGLYAFSSAYLTQYLPRLTCNNNQQEYYLTDFVGILRDETIEIDMLEMSKENQHEIMGVNDQEQLNELNKFV
jgi:UDP-N-acetylglucosamine diphosphorylase/glucosamine-1-phosphate N-acetyltransferase